MGEKIKTDDFIEIDYTGKIKETEDVFDTTVKQIAVEHGLGTEGAEFKPGKLCVGQGHMVKGLEDALIDKEIGNSYTIEVSAEDAFGKKNAKLIKLMPISVFKKQGIEPVVGLTVNVGGMMGIVRMVSGGRILVDYNHPLAGKDIVYDVTINKKITDDREKVISLLQLTLSKEEDVVLEEGKLTITTQKALPPSVQDQAKQKIVKFVNTIKEVNFVVPKEGKKQ